MRLKSCHRQDFHADNSAEVQFFRAALSPVPPEQANWRKDDVVSFEQLGVAPSIDKMLRITSDGRRLGLDQWIVNR